MAASVSDQCIRYWNEECPYSLPATEINGLTMLWNGNVVMWSDKNFYLLSLEQGVSDSHLTGMLRCFPIPKFMEGKYDHSSVSGILELRDGEGLCYWGNKKIWLQKGGVIKQLNDCLLYTSPSPRDS